MMGKVVHKQKIFKINKKWSVVGTHCKIENKTWSFKVTKLKKITTCKNCLKKMEAGK